MPVENSRPLRETTVNIPLSDLMKLLQNAASEGIKVGRQGTEVETTVPGIAMQTFLEYMRSG